jgi:ubiquinone biosynthesis protein Coq4
VADLVDSFIDSPQMQACVERFQALPGGAEMMASRYPPLQPAIAELQQLPPLSLGYRYARLILDQGYDPLILPAPADPIGCPMAHPTDRYHPRHPPCGWWLLHSTGGRGWSSGYHRLPDRLSRLCELGERSNPGSLSVTTLQFAEISRAISHCTSIGFNAQPLFCARWEKGWQSSVAYWRQQLGISHAADNAAYGLGAQ